MLEGQFFSRLLLIVIFGIFYIYTMMKMATYNSAETTPQKHILLKVIGVICIVLGISNFVIGIICLTEIQYPEQTIDFSDSPYQNVHISDTPIIWGYPTSEQHLALTYITMLFACIALAAYCFLYKKSNTKWWKKLFRFFYGLLMFAFYYSATDLNYFDILELSLPIFFCTMAGNILQEVNLLNKRKKRLAIQQRTAAILAMLDQEAETNASSDSGEQFMPQNESIDANTSSGNISDTRLSQETPYDDKPTQTDVNKTEITNAQKATNIGVRIPQYCRHCGRKIDYDGSGYCQYCGKEL